MNLYEKIIATYGQDHQILKAIEELTELSLALQHFVERNDTQGNVCEEIADVEIMLKQLRILFNETLINEIKELKKRA